MKRRWAVGMAVLLILVIGVASLTRTGRALFVQGKREVREALGLPKSWATNFNTDVAHQTVVPCPTGKPLVIVTGGQSNAANAYSDPLPADPEADAVAFYDGKCYKLKDPVLGATSQRGSLWTALGSSLSGELKRPIVFVNGAVGGVQLGDWLDRRSGYAERLRSQLALARKAGYSPDLVIWIQGETDAVAYVSKDDYRAELGRLVRTLSAGDLIGDKAKWIVFASTYCLNRPGSGAEIRAAVREFVATSPRYAMGPYSDRLTAAYRHDGCHFNGKGRSELVRETVPIVARLVS